MTLRLLCALLVSVLGLWLLAQLAVALLPWSFALAVWVGIGGVGVLLVLVCLECMPSMEPRPEGRGNTGERPKPPPDAGARRTTEEETGPGR